MATVRINSGQNPATNVTINGGSETRIPTTINLYPDPPTIISENNITNQIVFFAPSGYKASDCQYRIQGGAPVNATSTVIEIGDNNVGIGEVEIYVKQAGVINRSSSVYNEAAFTESVTLTTVTEHSNEPADFFTVAQSAMFLNMSVASRVGTSGTAYKIQFKLAAVPDPLNFMWFFVYRKDGATYDLVDSWQQVPIGDLVVGVNEMYIPSGWAVQAGDYVGFTVAGNSGLVAMFPRTEDGGTPDIRRAAVISLTNNKDFDAGTGYDGGFYPIILTT